MFKLPEDNGRVLGVPKEDITQEPLRFAVHPGKDRPMIAMSTANYADLKIMVSVNNFVDISENSFILFSSGGILGYCIFKGKKPVNKIQQQPLPLAKNKTTCEHKPFWRGKRRRYHRIPGI